MYPIIVFVYNKPDLTLQTLQALEDNFGAAESDVFIFSDGAKEGNSASIENVKKVRQVIRNKYAFRSCTIIEAAVNQGLGNSVIAGVTQVLQDHDAVIVIEDDVLSSRQFLTYMNSQLELYKGDPRVFAIGSWNYFFPESKSNFFMRFPDTIGWAVYRRSWRFFEPNSQKLISAIRSKPGGVEAFNVGGAYDYFNMLEQQNKRTVDSWGIRWYASLFLNNALCLFPRVSLTKHVGFGENATHCKEPEDIYRQLFEVQNNPAQLTKVTVKESGAGIQAYHRFYGLRLKLISRVINRVSRILALS